MRLSGGSTPKVLASKVTVSPPFTPKKWYVSPSLLHTPNQGFDPPVKKFSYTFLTPHFDPPPDPPPPISTPKPPSRATAEKNASHPLPPRPLPEATTLFDCHHPPGKPSSTASPPHSLHPLHLPRHPPSRTIPTPPQNTRHKRVPSHFSPLPLPSPQTQRKTPQKPLQSLLRRLSHSFSPHHLSPPPFCLTLL